MTKHHNIIILLDGEATAEAWLIDVAKDAYVIAADGGIRHAASLNVEPNLWVGDFDSSEPELRDRYKNVPLQEYSSDKAKSDGEIAIVEALSFKPKLLVIVGALGGQRTDHGLFNVSGALSFARKNPETEIVLTGAGETAMPIVPGKPMKIARSVGKTLSIVPFSDLTGLSIDGVRWPLNSIEVEFGSTHTLSNEIISEAKIRLLSGLAIAIVQTND